MGTNQTATPEDRRAYICAEVLYTIQSLTMCACTMCEVHGTQYMQKQAMQQSWRCVATSTQGFPACSEANLHVPLMSQTKLLTPCTQEAGQKLLERHMQGGCAADRRTEAPVTDYTRKLWA